MCFFDQTVWNCGCWRWGNLGQRCPAQPRVGETCGLKLIWSTTTRERDCGLCVKIAAKERRLQRMSGHVQRWAREGNRTATIEKTEAEMQQLRQSIALLRGQRWPDKLRYPREGQHRTGALFSPLFCLRRYKKDGHDPCHDMTEVLKGGYCRPS